METPADYIDRVTGPRSKTAGEMVERVARAIVRVFEVNFDACNPAQQEMARTRARAAIAAMREPTAAMTQSGECHDAFYRPEDNMAASVWKDMIDEALK